MEANSNTMESGAQGLGKILLEISQLDHILALFVSGKGDLGVDGLGCRFGENLQLLMVLTTSMVVLVACILFLVWRRKGFALSKPLEKPTPLVKEDEEDDSGKKKVTVFFGTQTGTAEGFAKMDYEDEHDSVPLIFKLMNKSKGAVEHSLTTLLINSSNPTSSASFLCFMLHNPTMDLEMKVVQVPRIYSWSPEMDEQD